MQSKTYFNAIRKCLFTSGIFGRPATWLIEELEDHFQQKVASFRLEGHDEKTAEVMAIEALGRPADVVQSAAETVSRSSWMARRPYVFSLVLGLAALLVNFCFVVVLIIVTMDAPDVGMSGWLCAELMAGLMNWTVLLVGGVFLWWLAHRFVMGWRTLFYACLSATVCVSLFGVFTIPHFAPGFGPKDGHVTIDLVNSPLGLLYGVCEGGVYSASGIAYGFSPTFPTAQFFYFHLLMPIILLLGFQYLMPLLAELKNLWRQLPLKNSRG